MLRVRTFAPPALVVVAALLAPMTARAGNGIHERTPVEWPADTPCMTVIDRSQQAVVHFEYQIPYEDTDVTMDEVSDSRRHQFIAFCRNHSPQDPLPVWLSWADVEAAEAVGITEKSDYTDEEVMETSSVYKDCFFRITPDDARKPITFAEAAKGFDWDTSGIPAGAYIIQGYTWEPAFNIWRKRPGVVHVVDGPDLTAVGPAAAIMSEDNFMFGEDTLMLEGCTRALPGSVLNVYWSLTGPEGLNWQPYAEGVPLEGDLLALPFKPPEEAIGQTVALRVDVVDPMQRSFSAYPPQLLTILPGSGGSGTGDCSDSGIFIGNEGCGESDSDGTTGSGDTSSGGGDPTTTTGDPGPGSTGGSSTGEPVGTSTSGSPANPGPNEVGCGCRSGAGERAPALAGLLLLGLRRRRAGARR